MRANILKWTLIAESPGCLMSNDPTLINVMSEQMCWPHYNGWVRRSDWEQAIEDYLKASSNTESLAQYLEVSGSLST
jgi:hypothetical protein